MPVRILIADDEEAPREGLRAAIETHWPEATIVAACLHGIDAWDNYLECLPDVCFLDVKMPGLTGFEVAKKIAATQQGCIVIFCTAYGEFALEAFETGALDYLLKPIENSRFLKTVERLKDRLTRETKTVSMTGPFSAYLDAAIAKLQVKKPMQHIQASVGKEIRLINVNDILFFESDMRYIRLIYRLGDEHVEALIRTPLKELLVELDATIFWQVHR